MTESQMETMVNFIFNLLQNAAFLYLIAIFIYILMSWVGGRDSAFGQVLGKVVDPYLDMFRSFIPPLGMIDLSPVIAIIVLNLARQGLYPLQQMILSWL